jgi:hypothetical protein
MLDASLGPLAPVLGRTAQAPAPTPARPKEDRAWARNWSKSLPMSKWLLPKLDLPSDADAAAAFVKGVTKEELRTRLQAVRLQGHLEGLWRAIEQLRMQPALTGEELSAKFTDEGEAYKGTMDMGPVSVFFRGLESLIGPPRIVGGSLRTAMEHEHCRAPDSNERFVRSMSKHAPRPPLKPWIVAMLHTRASATPLFPCGAGPTTPSSPRRPRSGRSSSRPRSELRSRL